MTEIIVVVLGIAIILYVLLGGADFGGGILEIFIGRKKADLVSKAIAPVWEANHVWLILVIVILFVGFPKVYSTIMLALHIPIILTLLGIVFRGSVFSFRSYDIEEEKTRSVYTTIFQISSVFTPVFLGVTLGAVILGDITLDTSAGFYRVYLYPWLNVFCFSLGIFVLLLFAFLASVYMTGEPIDKSDKDTFVNISKYLIGLLIISGLLVFLAAEIDGLHLFQQFLDSPVSISAVVLATACIPFLWKYLKKHHTTGIRIVAGFQTSLIIIGWFAVQFPVFIKISDGMNLTMQNTQAPMETQKYMLIALIVGILIIFPSIGYLFKTFKMNSR